MGTENRRNFESFLDNVFEVEAIKQNKSLSYREVLYTFEKLDIPTGSIVLINLTNSKDLLMFFFGAIKSGLVPVIDTHTALSERISELISAFGIKVVVKKGYTGNFKLPATEIEIQDYKIIKLHHDGILAKVGETIILTSGTSGFSSGCVFDFDTLLVNAQKHIESIGIRNSEVMLINLPLMYSFSIVAQVLAAYLTKTKVIISALPFNATEFISNIQKHGVTLTSLTPPLVKILLNTTLALPETLRVITIGSSPIDTKSLKRIVKKYPYKEIYVTYGLTEAGPRVSTLAAHEADECRLRSVGLPLINTHVKLRDTKILGYKELIIRSETLMKRKIGLVEGSARDCNLQSQELATGDLFDIDSEGYMYYKGRLSDFILTKEGEKVSLASVKRILEEKHSYVLKAVTKIKKLNSIADTYTLKVIVNNPPKGFQTYIKAYMYKNFRKCEYPANIEYSLVDNWQCFKDGK
ncbi:MAG: long-chain fatty acid--CoA ligase [Ignavibacteriae bacterium]|nr:MAG: long-chain fatty acid--CoA ligase [Ignavibacteriota bacterium]